MTRDEKIGYLANVFSIATVDGEVSAAERVVLESIADRLGVDASILQAAKNLLEAGGAYRLRILSSPSDRMANVEDMVAVAMADGRMDERETGPIERITEAMRYAQADMDMVVARAEARLMRLRKVRPDLAPAGGEAAAGPARRSAGRGSRGPSRGSRPPPVPVRPPRPVQPPAPPSKPAAAAPPPARATASVVEAEPAPEPPPSEPVARVPERGVAIAVADDRSLLYRFVAQRLKSAAESGCYARAGDTWHYGVWPQDRVADALALAVVAKPLPKRACFLEGCEMAWEDVFDASECAAARRASEHPAEYCFGVDEGILNPWGCRLASMGWSGFSDWFRLGRFESDDVYDFDKEAVRTELGKRLECARSCPFLRRAYADAAVSRLPDRVRPRGGWRLREAVGGSPGRRVETREYVHGCALRSDLQADAITPTGVRTAVRIVRQATRDCGLAEPSLSLLHRRGLEVFRWERAAT